MRSKHLCIALTLALAGLANPTAGQNSLADVSTDNQAETLRDTQEDNQVDTFGEPPCTRPPGGMVAWWPLDEPSPFNAADIIGAHDGTHVSGPTPGPGKVAGALNFDGVNDYVEVPHDPDLDMGIGNLSIDLWMRSEDTQGVAILVDKRTRDASGTVGYSLHLFSGEFRFQLADGNGSSSCSTSPGSSCTNWGSGVFVADNEWHHLAVTVDRLNSEGLKFYVDGALVAMRDPTVRAGSLDNDGTLRLGTGAFAETLRYAGEMDEVELFNRVLTESEIAGLFVADASGKCKVRLVTDWDVPICLDDDYSEQATTQVCNDSTDPKLFSLTYQAVLGGMVAGCTDDGPSIFTVFAPFPSPQVVPPAAMLPVVPARSCISVTFTAKRPSLFSSTGCYEAVLTDTGTGVEIRDLGSLRNSLRVCPRPIEGDVVVGPVETGEVKFWLTNTTGKPLFTRFQAIAMPQEGDAQDSQLSLNGLPIGEAVEGELTFAVDEMLELSVQVAIGGDIGLDIEEVVLLVDTGGGQFRALTSVQVRTQLAQVIFADGFECGDTSRWATVIP